MPTFTSHGITVEFDSNAEEVLEALENAVDRGLKVIGETAVNYAIDKAPHKTGNLQSAIDYEVEEDEVYIGVTNKAPYGKYVEFGTGVYAEEGGRQTPWSYQDEDGKWHHTNGANPQPFLRPAASEHTEEYMDILKESLMNA